MRAAETRRSETQRAAVATLLRAAAQGDRQAFEQLYHEQGPAIKAFLLRRCQHLGPADDDLVQEVFLRLWSNVRHIRDETVGPAYLFGIAQRVAWEWQRQQRRIERCAPNLEPRRRRDAVRETAAAADLYDELHRHISKLPANQRQAIELTYLGGLSTQQAANRLGCSCKAIERRRERGLQRLRTRCAAGDKKIHNRAGGEPVHATPT